MNPLQRFRLSEAKVQTNWDCDKKGSPVQLALVWQTAFGRNFEAKRSIAKHEPFVTIALSGIMTLVGFTVLGTGAQLFIIFLFQFLKELCWTKQGVSPTVAWRRKAPQEKDEEEPLIKRMKQERQDFLSRELESFWACAATVIAHLRMRVHAAMFFSNSALLTRGHAVCVVDFFLVNSPSSPRFFSILFCALQRCPQLPFLLLCLLCFKSHTVALLSFDVSSLIFSPF